MNARILLFILAFLLIVYADSPLSEAEIRAMVNRHNQLRQKLSLNPASVGTTLARYFTLALSPNAKESHIVEASLACNKMEYIKIGVGYINYLKDRDLAIRMFGSDAGAEINRFNCRIVTQRFKKLEYSDEYVKIATKYAR